MDDMTDVERNCMINKTKNKNGYGFNVHFRSDYIVEAIGYITKDQEITTYYNYCNIISLIF